VKEDIALQSASAWIATADTTVISEQIEQLYKEHCRAMS
jgi:hypothetical protein